MNTNWVIAFIIICSLGLTIAVNSTIIGEDSCSSTKKKYNEITWGLAVGTISLWVLSIFAIVFKTGFGFRFQKLFQSAGEYMLLTFFGSLLLPALIISGASDDHSGEIDSAMNNVAVIGLIMAVWVIASTVSDVMFDKKLYNMVTRSLGVKKTKYF